MGFFFIAIKIALRALRRNAMRSLLTTLGIIIGVAAVIAMVSISQGASVSVQAKIASLGNNMLVILSGSTTQSGVRTGMGGVPQGSDQDDTVLIPYATAERRVLVRKSWGLSAQFKFLQ